MSNLQATEKRSKIECTHCKSTTIDRIPRSKTFKLLLFWTGMKRFQCSKCDRKFYK